MEPQHPPAEAEPHSEPQLKRQRSREGRILLARALSGDSGGDGDEGYVGESEEGGGIGGGGSGDSGIGSSGGSGSGSGGGSGAVPRKCIPADASFPVSLEAMRWAAAARVAAGRFRGGKALHNINGVLMCHLLCRPYT